MNGLDGNEQMNSPKSLMEASVATMSSQSSTSQLTSLPSSSSLASNGSTNSTNNVINSTANQAGNDTNNPFDITENRDYFKSQDLEIKQLIINVSSLIESLSLFIICLNFIFIEFSRASKSVGSNLSYFRWT